jgi:hypothetical protein
VNVGYQVIYAFSGFVAPVSNLPTVNVAKAGSTIAVKFGRGGNQGMAVLAGSPVSRPVHCETGAQLGPESAAQMPGNSGPSYNARTGQYQRNWKTESGWKGSCREYLLRLVDGSEHTARFRFN